MTFRQLHCDQILASLNDANAGPTYSVSSLAAALVKAGCSAAVLTLAEWRGIDPPPPMAGVELLQFSQSKSSLTRALGKSPALRQALLDRAASSDIFHTHGLWLMPNIYPGTARPHGSSVKVVHSPRGMLGADALRFSALKKRLFWLALQRNALRRADCIHATAASEYEEVRAVGLTNPVAVIPNGIDVAMVPDATPTARSRTVLSLGRIHPKKGLDNLIVAWAALESEFSDWHLRIVGYDENGYADVLRRLCSEIGAVRIAIEPPLHGALKSAAYQSAALFVLPSLNENFAMTVAEAMAHGLPVVSSKGAPWSGLIDKRCGWWVDQDVATLRATLSTAMRLPSSERAAMGARAQAWMAEDFSWESVADRMLKVYEWLCGRGPIPDTVRTD